VTGVRAALIATGVGFGLWGLWLMRDFTGGELLSTGTWLAGGILLHDVVLAPVTVALGVLAARLLPAHLRGALGVGFLIWATLTVAFVPVLSGQGGKPDNDTILNRPYVTSWLVLTAALLAATVLAVLVRRAQARKAQGRTVQRGPTADAGP
jgi:Kef-type K+ transport system membrane component KefB